MSENPVNMSCVCLMLLILLNLSDFGRGQVSQPNPYFCFNAGNFTASSFYRSNLRAALFSLPTNNSEYGFYSESMGAGDNTAYAIAHCRADIQIDECQGCVEKAGTELVQSCPNQTQAIRWYEMCMLHYSDKPISAATTVSDPGLNNIQVVSTVQAVSNPMQFQKDRAVLLDNLRAQAVNGSSLLKVGVGSRNVSDNDTIYALLQCVPHLSSEQCDDCLIQASQTLNESARGARALRASCSIRYAFDQFYNETRLSQLGVAPILVPSPDNTVGPGSTNTREKKDGITTKIVMIIVPIIVVGLILATCALIIFLRRRTKARNLESGMNKTLAESLRKAKCEGETLEYSFSEIKAATNDFSDDNKLGQGGFGPVFKGKLSDLEIAVKQLSNNSTQGDKEFLNEVKIIAQLQHRNLVKLLGYSLGETEKLLIYEYAPNGSLDKIIFDPEKRSQLDWKRLYEIVMDIARGLLYLHQDSRLKIIHCDLKAGNVLLDENMNAKIADFGTAKLFKQDQTRASTSVAIGTPGYMSPEYISYGEVSAELDMFSFGVLVLEIISGRKNQPQFPNGKNIKCILMLARQNWSERTTENIVDPTLLERKDDVDAILRCVHIALLCVQENPKDRPLMKSVMEMLTSHTEQLPLQPASVAQSRFSGGIQGDEASGSESDSVPLVAAPTS